MNIEPLIVSQIITLLFLIVLIICPWQKITYTINEIIKNGDSGENNIKSTIREITYSLYKKSIIYLGDNNNDHSGGFEINNNNNSKLLFFTIFSFIILTLLIYIVLTKALMDRSLPYSFELLAHFLPLLLIFLIVALTFVATELKVNVCVDNNYNNNSNSSGDTLNCFELNVSNNQIQLNQDISSSDSFEKNNSTINSIPLIGYYLTLFSVINSILLSFVHIIRYDSLKLSSKSNKDYTLLQTYI